MKIYNYRSLSIKQRANLLKRPAIDLSATYKTVEPILRDIKKNGLKSVISYARKFDGLKGNRIRVTEVEIKNSEKLVSESFKKAVKIAAKNISSFHKKQLPKKYSLETMTGIECSRQFRAIENVGLYIPGGTAILPSTLLMLAIPANIAGCKRIVVCSPAIQKVSAEVLYIAKQTGIKEFYKIGGAQAIGLMAFGAGKISKVDKIFGPGNQFVTAAKALVSIDPEGCAIDMPAGPSEVLIIADKSADPSFIAADLLSQAEHGNDSQVVLCTNSESIAEKVNKEIILQTEKLERKKFIEKSLSGSYSIIFDDISKAFDFSNSYAPEHLIINVKNSKRFMNRINNAGSVFMGKYSPESVGDYASGTNHSLPTYGYSKSIGGVAVEQFMKGITFQSLTKKGLENIAETVIQLAETEKLQAHAEAVKIRLKND